MAMYICTHIDIYIYIYIDIDIDIYIDIVDIYIYIYILHITYCILHITYYILHIAYCILHITYYILHIHIHIHIHIYICICIHTHMYIYIYMYTYCMLHTHSSLERAIPAMHIQGGFHPGTRWPGFRKCCPTWWTKGYQGRDSSSRCSKIGKTKVQAWWIYVNLRYLPKKKTFAGECTF